MISKVLLLAMLAIPSLTLADVNLKNGNFYISYADITQESASQVLEMIRTYNSKATYIGWFGYGWGSDFETHLTAMPDGTVAVTENGTGVIKYYHPAKGADVDGGVAKITAVIASANHLSEANTATLRDKLLHNEELRLQKVKRYSLQFPVPVNTALQGSSCPKDALTRVAEGYKRISCQDRIDWFDLQGHLISRQFEDGYTVSAIYEGNRPKVIKDTLGQALTFTWTSNGLTKTVVGSKNTGYYDYDDQNNLIKWVDVNGNSHEYEYDNKHNMTAVIYVDSTRRSMTYDENSAVTSVTDRNGSKTTYDYWTDPQDSLHYWTRVSQIMPNGESVSREYEFKNQVDAKGTTSLVSAAASSASDRQETRFDDKGRIIHQVNGQGGSIDYDYDSRCGKLSRVVHNDAETSTFIYDKGCNLKSAEKDHKIRVELRYDYWLKKANGSLLIKRMVEHDLESHTKRILMFKYNKQRKPMEISMVGEGKIRIEYDANGEISKIESDNGAKIALLVTMTFKRLLEVVKVAGINI